MAIEPDEAMPASRSLKNALILGGCLAVVYFFAGKLGLRLAFLNASASPLWPPTGIALAGLLLWGSRVTPAIFIGAFLVNVTTQGTNTTSFAIATGNTLEALAGAWLVRKVAAPSNLFDKPRTIIAYVGLGAVLSTSLSPTFGVTSLWAAGFTPWSQYGSSWFTWWLGDVVSNIIVAPFLVIWASGPLPTFRKERLVEILALALTLVVLNMIIFPSILPIGDQRIPIGYLALLPLLWAAFRFGQRGASAAAVLTSGFALYGTLHGVGPYVKSDLNESLLLTQTFVATVTLTALLVAAVVSEQRMVRNVLGFKESELRLITDMTPLMLIRCTRDLHYAFVNRAYSHMVGRDPEGLLGRPLVEIIGPGVWEKIRPHIENVLQGRTVEYEADMHFQASGEHCLRVVSKPDYDERGQIRGWVDSIDDITERKQAGITRARLSAIVESSDDAIISKDLDGKIVTWNAAAERMFGYRPQEIIGQSVLRIVPAQLHEQENEILEQLRRGLAVRLSETLRLTKAGRSIPVSLTISPVRDAEGRIIGSSSISQDITERMKSERELQQTKAALERHAKDLEATVAERTAQLRESNAELEAFSFSLSHDLRAPLRAIREFSKIVLEDHRSALGPDAANLERVIAAATRLDRMIRDVLALSRLSRQHLHAQPVDVENLLLTITSERPELQAPRADIQISRPLPSILGDEASLSQCVTNLLDNAVKFVPAGIRPRVVVKAQTLDDRVRLSFEDNGIGIDPASQQRIFEVFQRGHGGSLYEGSGLGLAIVRKAVERMGGSVGVESQLGQGSRFWLELPKA